MYLLKSCQTNNQKRIRLVALYQCNDIFYSVHFNLFKAIEDDPSLIFNEHFFFYSSFSAFYFECEYFFLFIVCRFMFYLFPGCNMTPPSLVQFIVDTSNMFFFSLLFRSLFLSFPPHLTIFTIYSCPHGS